MKKWNVLLLLALGFSPLAFSQTAVKAPLWADLDDIITFAPNAMPEAAEIERDIKSDTRYLRGGAKFKYGIHLDSEPQALGGGDLRYQASALMVDRAQRLFFRKFSITVSASRQPAVQDVQVLSDTDLDQMHFQVSAGLIDRMVVLEDVEHSVEMVFPLGVGGLDEGVTGHGVRILTPQFHNAFLRRSTVIASLSQPGYFRGLPYMPITNAAGMTTAVAFHISILSDTDWASKGGNYLVRGFESHGCMRMREKNLLEFFTIVMKSADEKLPVNVDYFVWNRNSAGVRDESLGQVAQINPYPVVADHYMTVQNFGSAKRPVAKRDDNEHLLIMDQANRVPNLTHLAGFNADDLTDWKEFEGLTADTPVETLSQN